MILNLLDYYEVVDKMLAIRCDITSSNTGPFSGAISVLEKLLTFSFFGFSVVIISVRSTFPTSWKNSLAKYKRAKEGSLCPSAEGRAFHQTDKIKIRQERAPGWQDGS